MALDNMEQKICDIIDQKQDEIIAFGRDIWLHAETGYKEHRTAKQFADALERLGLPSEVGLAVTGVKSYLKKGDPDGPTVAVMGELDALPISTNKDSNPETGAAHCCGHNAQLAGVLGAAMALTDPDIRQSIAGNIVFFGVPAEEFVEAEFRAGLRKEGIARYGGGKCELIRIGAMDDIDITIGHHASSGNEIDITNCTSNGVASKVVTFKGRSAHAAGSPEKGIDSLAAMNIAMHAIDVQRETFRDKDTVRVYGFVSRGGEASNVIADDVTMEYLVRAKTIPALKDADAKVSRALESGSVATGCGLYVETVPGYMPTVPVDDVSVLSEAIRDLAADYPVRDERIQNHMTGSTDYGDVSSIMPLLQFHTGGYSGTFHNPDVAVEDEYLAYVIPAKIFALTAYKLLKENAKKANELLDGFTPLMTKTEYLEYMEGMLRVDEIAMKPLPVLED